MKTPPDPLDPLFRLSRAAPRRSIPAGPFGMTFIGRGFDVRIGAPLNHTIEEGLQRVTAEVVDHCPTSALCFLEEKSP